MPKSDQSSCNARQFQERCNRAERHMDNMCGRIGNGSLNLRSGAAGEHISDGIACLNAVNRYRSACGKR